MSDWGGGAAAPQTATIPKATGGGSDWGGGKPGARPIGHVTTAFADPARKPFFDTSALDAQIEDQNAAAGKTASAVGKALQIPDQAVYNAATPVRDFLRSHNYGVIPTSLDDLKNYGSRVGRVTPLSPLGEAAEQTVFSATGPLGLSVAGRSGIARLGEQAEKYVPPAVVKTGATIAKKVPGGKKVTDTIAKVHDFTGVHSAAKRALMEQHGPGWLDQYATARARKMAADAHNATLPADAPMALFQEPDVDPRILKLLRRDEQQQFEASPLTKLGRIPSDVITAGMFAQPFGHGANISTLGLLSDPLAVGRALGRAVVDTAKQPFRKGESAESIAERHAPAIAGGAVSGHSTERDNVLTRLFDSAAGGAEKVPGIGGQVLSMIPKAVRGLYKWSGNALWKFDDEVKAQRFNSLVKGGMTPERAGLRVGGELVDYENKSPAAKNLRPVMPFSTWRTKAPLATARNIVENPGRAATIARTVPAVLGGKQGEDPDTGKPYTSSLPTAELNELLTDPRKYAAGGIGPWPRYMASKTNELLERAARKPSEERQRWGPTYGVQPEQFLLNESPILSQILQMTGGGMFQRGQRPSALTDLLSLIRVHP